MTNEEIRKRLLFDIETRRHGNNFSIKLNYHYNIYKYQLAKILLDTGEFHLSIFHRVQNQIILEAIDYLMRFYELSPFYDNQFTAVDRLWISYPKKDFMFLKYGECYDKINIQYSNLVDSSMILPDYTLKYNVRELPLSPYIPQKLLEKEN